MMAGLTMDGMITGAPLDGMKVGNKPVTIPKAHVTWKFWSWCHAESEAVWMGEHELGHRSCSKHISIELRSNWRRRWQILFLTASGDCILGGGTWQFQGYDENCFCRSLNERLTGAQKVLCGAWEIVCKGRQDFYLGSDSGFMLPVHSKIGHEMTMHSKEWWVGKDH